MNITIFGGTGASGLHTIKSALDKGHQITVYARNPSKISFQHKNLHLIQGELTDTDKIDQVMEGTDAVISLLGPMNFDKSLPISNGVKTIIQSMHKHVVKRLVIAVSSSYRDPKDRFHFWIDFGVWVLKVIARNSILKEIKELGKVTVESKLDWTMIRLPKLSNQNPKGMFNVGYSGDGKVNNFWLSRADLGDFLVNQLEDKTYLHQAPIVSN